MRLNGSFLLCCGLSLAALATSVRVVHFLADFSSSWPEMLCNDPLGVFQFEVFVAVPMLISCAAQAGGMAARRLQSSGFDWLLVGVGMVAAFVLVRIWQVVDRYDRAWYDAGCAHEHEWLGPFPVLDLFTRPYAGYVACGVILVFITVTTAVELRRAVS